DSKSIPAIDRIWCVFAVERVVALPSRSLISRFTWACAAEATPKASASDATSASLIFLLPRVRRPRGCGRPGCYSTNAGGGDPGTQDGPGAESRALPHAGETCLHDPAAAS